MKLLQRTFLMLASSAGILTSVFVNYRLSRFLKDCLEEFYSAWLSKSFRSFGDDIKIGRHLDLLNGKHISIGSHSRIGQRVVLNAWKNYGRQTFDPEIIIGRNSSIGDDNHITAINSIKIGDNVLIGKKVTITDNSHGENITLQELQRAPIIRALFSKGEVIIDDNVWIGDKVTILPGVHIGENSIIGSNSVVTKDIPRNCVAAGIPAKKIKDIY